MPSFVMEKSFGIVGVLSETSDGWHTIVVLGRKFETMGVRRSEQAAIEAISDRFRREKIRLAELQVQSLDANIAITPIPIERRKLGISISGQSHRRVVPASAA